MNRRTFLKTVGIISAATPFLSIKELFAAPIIISACIVTKNHAKYIKQCLLSVQNITDEIIIVDLGSNDGTIKIAESFGAKIFNYKWSNNISIHKNQAIKHAVGDWVLFIDAEEKLVLQDVTSINMFKSKLYKLPKIYNAIVMQHHTHTIWHTARLFRRKNIQYHGVVHPQPKIIQAPPKTIYYPGIYLEYQ